ncbi:DNA-directed RNA polymerase III subunit rpc7 [Colletotrichum truncatum]|uniref:DNA-directed RNA polymerase III subunit rpc7 n=1 Tax=Colletotrichum truncatum TaxID=5467 RepID=A0ACC3ZL70_COLTU|nr:DNA-directed RNA polymerase III subunit rpc7 [Colletotrichum truncatum]KAF6787004.1 DNA-directed RNA polymerase III subunit rpc7 [Colletotrichum truncatum]
MSRGGRGGGRGGRGGRTGPQLPWDNGEHAPDTRPSELFPQYNVPTARPLSDLEQANVNAFLLFRRQFQDGPLYTRKRTWGMDPMNTRKLYGQDQVNAKYGVRTRATADPFTGVQTYSQKFTREERALPEFGGRPFCKEFFPKELHPTLDGDDVAPGEKRRGGEAKRLRLSKITALPTAEDVFQMNEHEEIGPDGAKKTLEALERIPEGEGEGVEEEWEEGAEEEEQDVEYDDEDAGDYDAENYFDDGEFGDDDGGDDDHGGREGSY